MWFTHCGCSETEVYPVLKCLVPSAPAHTDNPAPGSASRPESGELAELRAAIIVLALNDDKFALSAPIRLAMLELAGYETNKALDVLGITDAAAAPGRPRPPPWPAARFRNPDLRELSLMTTRH
jgi:hypothetical protein